MEEEKKCSNCFYHQWSNDEPPCDDCPVPELPHWRSAKPTSAFNTEEAAKRLEELKKQQCELKVDLIFTLTQLAYLIITFGLLITKNIKWQDAGLGLIIIGCIGIARDVSKIEKRSRK